MSAPIWLLPTFALIAASYASVGLGGATTYVAVLSLTAMPYTQIPPLVLALNLVASGIVYAGFLRAGRAPASTLLVPLLTASVPAAFLGGLVPLRERHFMTLLAFALLLAGLRLLLGPGLRDAGSLEERPPKPSTWMLLGVGFGIGLLAGMTGIGGGIYLGPILLLRRAADIRAVPAVTSAFVFFNSAAGLAGHLTRVEPALGWWLPLGAAVIVGAVAGAFASLRWLSRGWLQRAFGTVLIAAALLNGVRAL